MIHVPLDVLYRCTNFTVSSAHPIVVARFLRTAVAPGCRRRWRKAAILVRRRSAAGIVVVRVTQITLTALTVVVDIRTGRWAGVPGKFLRPRFRTCYIMSYCCCSKSTVCCVSWARSGPCLFCTDLCCVLPTDRISWTQEVLRNTGYGWECVVSMGRSPPITVCMCETRFERNKAVAA